MGANDGERTLLAAALGYARLGWLVHPIRPRDKRPLLPKWPEVSSTNEAQIGQWWSEWPSANVGVVTGPNSGILVLDVDGETGERSLAELIANAGELPMTCTQRTGRGRQLIFQYPSTITIRNVARLRGYEGLDVRGAGGYIVVPPSIHPSGALYRWETPSNPLEGNKPSVLPEPWIELLAKPQAREPQPSTLKNWTVRKGNRNDHLFRAASSLRSRGLSVVAIASALKAENRERCRPPLTEREVELIAQGISRYPDRAAIPGNDAQGPWDPPIPFGQFTLPTFPLEAIPAELSALSGFCAGVAESYQVPVDMVAMLALVVGGAALAKRIIVRGGQDWTEPVNIYAVVIMPPGERKSSVMKIVAKPLDDHEQELAQLLAPLIAQSQTERTIISKALAEATANAAKAKNPEERAKWADEARLLTTELNEKEILSTPRFVADDATPEAIARLLHENGGRLAILSPEGDTFELMAGRYSANRLPNLGVYLMGHCGDHIRVDRVSKDRPAQYVRNPALSIGLAVQPDVIKGLIQTPGFRGRGLLARFAYSIPESKVGFRALRPCALPVSIKNEYECIIRGALKLPLVKEHGEEVPLVLELSDEALREFDTFRAYVEAELRVSGKLGAIRDWGSKLPGLVLRIAGIFHGLMHQVAGGLRSTIISPETMLCAIAIGEYLTAHARAAFYEMDADASVHLARRLLDWVSEEQVNRFTRRDAFLRLRGLINKVEQVDAPLSLLIEHGYVRGLNGNTQSIVRKRGRKPSPVFEINPMFIKQNELISRNSLATGNCAHSDHCALEEVPDVLGT